MIPILAAVGEFLLTPGGQAVLVAGSSVVTAQALSGSHIVGSPLSGKTELASTLRKEEVRVLEEADVLYSLTGGRRYLDSLPWTAEPDSHEGREWARYNKIAQAQLSDFRNKGGTTLGRSVPLDVDPSSVYLLPLPRAATERLLATGNLGFISSAQDAIAWMEDANDTGLYTRYPVLSSKEVK
jgi:hypothetical protein